MNVEVKYAIGDKVRFRHAAVIVDKEECTFCAESGYITGLDGTQEECPRCEGKGYIEKEINGELIHDGIIQDIQVYVYHDKEPYVLYRMAGWSWSQTWIAEYQIIEVLNDVN